ncbi:MAG: SRPBCC family protein [Acidimicrobiia bacterium]
MPVGLTKDAGWEIGVSRTLPYPLDDVRALLTSADGVQLWLGDAMTLPTTVGAPYEAADGATGELRGYESRRRIRLTHRPRESRNETTIQATLEPKAAGTTLRFHQERMRSPKERERQRAHWKRVVDELDDALSGRRA